MVIAGEHFFRFNHPLEVERNASLRKGSQGTSKGFEFARDEYIKAQTARYERERERLLSYNMSSNFLD